jgi:triacylglycerol lipase
LLFSFSTFNNGLKGKSSDLLAVIEDWHFMVVRHVILLHGLFRTRFSLWKLQRALEDQGYKVWNKSYPSTRCSITDLADELFEQISEEFQDHEEPLSIVTHSLGGIIARALISRHGTKLPPISRVVQLAPPNQGAQIVDRLKHLWLFKAVAGQAGRELSQDDQGPAEENGLYPLSDAVEVGVIAGGKGDDKGYAPWLKGDNDGTVEVSSTFLSEARDHILLGHIHTFIMNATEAIENTIHFLDHGQFLDGAVRLSKKAEGGA